MILLSFIKGIPDVISFFSLKTCTIFYLESPVCYFGIYISINEKEKVGMMKDSCSLVVVFMLIISIYLKEEKNVRKISIPLNNYIVSEQKQTTSIKKHQSSINSEFLADCTGEMASLLVWVDPHKTWFIKHWEVTLVDQ